MYSYKTIVWRNLEVIAKNPDTIMSVSKFYDTIALVYFLSCITKSVSPNMAMIDSRDALIRKWRNSNPEHKQTNWIRLQRQISSDEAILSTFSEYIDKNVEYNPEDDILQFDRRYVPGCFGTVVE